MIKEKYKIASVSDYKGHFGILSGLGSEQTIKPVGGLFDTKEEALAEIEGYFKLSKEAADKYPPQVVTIITVYVDEDNEE